MKSGGDPSSPPRFLKNISDKLIRKLTKDACILTFFPFLKDIFVFHSYRLHAVIISFALGGNVSSLRRILFIVGQI
jgi:hypothetical protein